MSERVPPAPGVGFGIFGAPLASPPPPPCAAGKIKSPNRDSVPFPPRPPDDNPLGAPAPADPGDPPLPITTETDWPAATVIVVVSTGAPAPPPPALDSIVLFEPPPPPPAPPPPQPTTVTNFTP